MQCGQQFVFYWQVDGLEVGWVFDFWYQVDVVVGMFGLLDQEGQDFVQVGDVELVVVGGIVQFWQVFVCIQGFQFGQGEVFGELVVDFLIVDYFVCVVVGEFWM